MLKTKHNVEVVGLLVLLLQWRVLMLRNWKSTSLSEQDLVDCVPVVMVVVVDGHVAIEFVINGSTPNSSYKIHLI